jgi:1-aminocyclopropane-1-carboxylate deaminase/D-cysteine desulfhydrase-like pyridoxal-dependent ACC family enzyme
VNAALELAAQCRAGELPVPQVIYIAGGTLGAAAGLYVGLRAAGLTTELSVVRTSSRASANDARLRVEIEGLADLLHGRDSSFPLVRFDPRLARVDHRFAAPGYARPSEAGAYAAAIARAASGLELDPTYSAKAFAAVLADRRRGREVLFWNTYDAREVLPRATPSDLPLAFRRYFG